MFFSPMFYFDALHDAAAIRVYAMICRASIYTRLMRHATRAGADADIHFSPPFYLRRLMPPATIDAAVRLLSFLHHHFRAARKE